MWISALQIYGKRETWMESYSLWRLKDESFIESWKIIQQWIRPTIRLTSYNVISWHDKIRQWHAWASVDVVNVTRNKTSWGNIFLLYLLSFFGYFFVAKIWNFWRQRLRITPCPRLREQTGAWTSSFFGDPTPPPPPPLETPSCCCWWVGGWSWPESCNLRLFQTTCTSFCNLQAQSRLTLSSTFDMGNNKL